jgi:eukaryotic-like serine/threonine-protein kinase
LTSGNDNDGLDWGCRARGELLGDYVLEEVIGAGEVGTIFRVTRVTDDREFALKLMRPALAEDPLIERRFGREATVSAKLKHPYAVRIRAQGRHDGCPYIVMDLAPGVPLSQVMEEAAAPLPLPRVLPILWALADVLAAAHRQAIVHRDLNPADILVAATPHGERVTVVDFGLAFIAEQGDSGVGRLTEPGLPAGTPGFTAPEQIRGLAVTSASDVYGLGCVAYTMLCGRPPFDAPNPTDLANQHLFLTPAPPSRFGGPGVQTLDPLVLEMLAKRTDMRPLAADIRDRLGEVAADLRIAMPGPPPPRRVTLHG